MIDIFYSRSFIKDTKNIPSIIINRLADAVENLSINPFASKLHTKKLSGELAGFFSFRITREWRVIFLFQNQTTIELISIGHRKDIYR